MAMVGLRSVRSFAPWRLSYSYSRPRMCPTSRTATGGPTSTAGRVNRTTSTSSNNWIKSSVSTVLISGSLLISIYYLNWSSKDYYVRKYLKKGTKPKLRNVENAVPRDEIEEEIKNMVLKNTSKCYGIILGPAGTGKSYLVAKVCNDHSRYVIYHMITVPSLLPHELAEKVGMKLQPNILDILIANIAPGYSSCFTLPTDFKEALNFVFKTINKEAEILKSKVTIVLDGVDIVAKKSPNNFIQLIETCKYMADEGNINIVLVSSEGLIIPMIKQTSAHSRAHNHVIEVLDLSKKQTIDYLTKFNVPNAELVYEFTGGRLIHLQQCIANYEGLVSTGKAHTMSNNEIFTYMCKHLIVWNVYPTLQSFDQLQEEKIKTTILNMICNKEVVDIQILKNSCQDVCGTSSKFSFYNTLHEMVKCHLFRYTTRGGVTWHSSMIKTYVINNYDKIVRK